MRVHSLVRLSPLVLFAATAVVAACDSSPTDQGDTRTFLLVIKPSDATILNGRQLQLNVTSQGAKDQVKSPSDVLWSSSDDGVATVTEDGVVTGMGNGAAQITAWWAGHRGFATVKVFERGRSGPKPELPPPGDKGKR
jgi:Bacterial Ig-like domain (group 2)